MNIAIFNRKEKNIIRIFLVLAFVSMGFAYSSIYSGALEVHFLDVGQGDSIFIQTPNRYQILVDGGPGDSEVARSLSSRMPFYDKTLDFVIATHLDADHIGGLINVIEEFSIGAVLVSDTTPENILENEFFRITEHKNIKIIKVSAGERIILDNNVYLDVLWPFGESSGHSNNDNSIVLRLSYKEDSFLFTGDIERYPEIVLSSYSDLVSDVLKVGHHGSKTSSSEYFLNKVQPKVAVIQSGQENRYGHPHEVVLKRLMDRGVEVLRNDENGVISIYSYGDSI